MVNTAKTRLEIYKDSILFFDQFKSAGWVASPSGGITFPDDDSVTVTVQSGYVVQDYGKAVLFDADVYTHAVIRVSAYSANGWMLYLQQEIGGAWVQVASGSAAGIFDVDFSLLFSGNCTGVELVAGGVPGNYVSFDLLCICKGLLVADDEDLVDVLQVNLPVLRDGVSGLQGTVNNVDSAYSAVKEHDAVILYLGRSGSSGSKVFGGRIIKLTTYVPTINEKYLLFEAHGHCLQLQHPPARLTYGYDAVNGKTIIEDCFALTTAVARHPTDNMWFDSAGSSGSTNDSISSVYSHEFDSENPYSVITQIIDEASNPSAVVGFELVELPSGCVIGHLRGSNDFVCSITPDIRKYTYVQDALLVVNRATVYGAKQRSEPTTPTNWTDGDSANWVAEKGTLSDDNAVPSIPFGTYCLKCVSEPTGGCSPYVAKFKRSFSGVTGKGLGGYGKLCFSAYNRYWVDTINPPCIRLFAPDVSNCFECTPDVTVWDYGKWISHVFVLGETNEYSADKPNGQWRKVGSPSWLNLSAVEFEFQWITFPYAYIALCAVCFTEGAYRGTANDTLSQAKSWGIIECEPVSDSSLLSDAACLQKATASLASKSDSEKILEPVIVDGDALYRAGDKVTLNSVQYVIREVVHTVKNNVWDTELKI